jgi:hypothetical protein
MKPTWQNRIEDFPAAFPCDDGSETARRTNNGWQCGCEKQPALDEKNIYDSKSIGNE